MRITRGTVDQLAAEAERITGRTMIESIIHTGSGTKYVMAESMISTYKGARAAAAYLLGVLSGADPAGPVNWVEHRPGWVAQIDAEFRLDEIGKDSLRAYKAGREYGRQLRPGRKPARDRYSVIITYEHHGDSAVMLSRVSTVGTWADVLKWLAGQNPDGTAASVEIGRVLAEGTAQELLS